jgi:hypothetical protein
MPSHSSKTHVVFFLKTEDRKGCPRPVKVWIDVILVGNDAFTTGDCHGSNSLIVSKCGFMWCCKWPVQLWTRLVASEQEVLDESVLYFAALGLFID